MGPIFRSENPTHFWFTKTQRYGRRLRLSQRNTLTEGRMRRCWTSEISIARNIANYYFRVLTVLLLIPALGEAHVVRVQMSAPTIAFGGYSWPGVGQYEKITGVA